MAKKKLKSTKIPQKQYVITNGIQGRFNTGEKVMLTEEMKGIFLKRDLIDKKDLGKSQEQLEDEKEEKLEK